MTRDLIILGYEDPEHVYKGKFPDPMKWDYWEDYEGDLYDLGQYDKYKRREWVENFWNEDEFAPISKYYYKGWIGNLKLGVLLTAEEYNGLDPKKRGEVHDTKKMCISSKNRNIVMEVCVCSGFDEDTRVDITEHQDELIGNVVEVKAQQVFKDTGKLRHPRFLRFREDKEPGECTWADHVG